jgi:hypothetical protein
MATKKGSIPWNKGKTGIYSKEVLESNRLKHLGKKFSEDHKKKIGLKMKGRIMSEEHRRKMSENNWAKKNIKGKTYEELYGQEKTKEIKEKMANNWAHKFKGHFPQSTLEKMSKRVLGNKNPMYGIRGPDSHAWLGGLKYFPYDHRFNKEFKYLIKSRDNFQCIKCSIFELDNKALTGQGLQVHHINYLKDDTNEFNCCSLCHRCNAEVNFNRESWIIFFKDIMKRRYGYK